MIVRQLKNASQEAGEKTWAYVGGVDGDAFFFFFCLMVIRQGVWGNLSNLL